MAIPNGITLTPTQGSGNNNISVAGTENTSRLQRIGSSIGRTTTIPVKSVTVNLIQEANAEVLTWEASSKIIPKTGGTINITGTTNTNKITFSTEEGTLIFVLPTTYSANNTTITNGEVITGDPGASALFPFAISISVDSNVTIEELTGSIIATYGDSNKTEIITLTQEAGDATLNIIPDTLTFSTTSAVKTATVTSNTSWIIS